MIFEINTSVENWKLILIRYTPKYVYICMYARIYRHTHIYIHTYTIHVCIIENLSYKINKYIWRRPMIRVIIKKIYIT